MMYDPTPGHVKRYQRQKLLADVVSTIASLLWLAILAFVFGPLLGTHLTAAVGENRWARMAVMAVLVGVTIEAVTFPIEFWSSYLVEHQHGLSTQTPRAWIIRRIKGYFVGGGLGLLLVWGLYAVIWLTGEWWWVWATAGWLAVTLILGRIVPIVILPLFYKVSRLEDESLLSRLRTLCAGTGLAVEGVYRLHLSDETRKANAALAGLGKTRRVLLGDTLLDSFTPEEIEVVFAHEVGHHVHRHLVKMIIYRVVLTLAGFWLVDVALRWSASAIGYRGMDDPAALPLVLLVLAIFGLFVSPLGNAVSRYFEVQCDTYALNKTGNHDAYRSAFTKLASMNKSDPTPHPAIVWFFYDHPPIGERLRLAETLAQPAANAPDPSIPPL